MNFNCDRKLLCVLVYHWSNVMSRWWIIVYSCSIHVILVHLNCEAGVLRVLSRGSVHQKFPCAEHNSTMLIAGSFRSLQLLFFLFSLTESIRLLKHGRKIDAEGREYKSPRYEIDEVETNTSSQVNSSSPVDIKCTDSSMIIVVNLTTSKQAAGHHSGSFFWEGTSKGEAASATFLPLLTGDMSSRSNFKSAAPSQR